MLSKCTGILAGQDELAQEARPVADVVVLVILGEVEDVLAEKLRLLRVGDAKLRREVQYLELDNVLLGGNESKNKY